MKNIKMIGYILPENVNVQKQTVTLTSGFMFKDIITDAASGKSVSVSKLKKNWKALVSVYPWLKDFGCIYERDWVSVSELIDSYYTI